MSLQTPINAPTSLKLKLTTAAIQKHLVPPLTAGKPTVLYDTEVTGFGAYRTSAKMPGSFFIHFRIGKRMRKKGDCSRI